MEDYLAQQEINEQVSIYSDSSDLTTSTEVPFPTRKFADEIFGGFENDIFYDYLNLFVIFLFVIFCIKIFAIFFEK